MFGTHCQDNGQG